MPSVLRPHRAAVDADVVDQASEERARGHVCIAADVQAAGAVWSLTGLHVRKSETDALDSTQVASRSDLSNRVQVDYLTAAVIPK